jgi:hypothetical protein
VGDARAALVADRVIVVDAPAEPSVTAQLSRIKL